MHTHTHTHTHTQVSLIPPWEDQCEWHRMTRMTGPDCAVMCNLINIHTRTQTHTHTHTSDLRYVQWTEKKCPKEVLHTTDIAVMAYRIICMSTWYLLAVGIHAVVHVVNIGVLDVTVHVRCIEHFRVALVGTEPADLPG